LASQDATVGGEKGASEVVVPSAKTQKIKGTTTIALDFDESDDEVHDEEAEHDRVSHLSESTINVITGERVSFQLENGISTGVFLLHVFLFCLSSFNSCFFVFVEKIFPDSSSQRETSVDIGKIKEVA
jgi:hypothetical protein